MQASIKNKYFLIVFSVIILLLLSVSSCSANTQEETVNGLSKDDQILLLSLTQKAIIDRNFEDDTSPSRADWNFAISGTSDNPLVTVTTRKTKYNRIKAIWDWESGDEIAYLKYLLVGGDEVLNALD